jgi:hypothetical protein
MVLAQWVARASVQSRAPCQNRADQNFQRLSGRLEKKDFFEEAKEMFNRRTLSFSVFAAGLLALCLPVAAAAQGGRWGRDRDNRDNRNDRYGRYDRNHVRDSIRRLDGLSKTFQKDLDWTLDHSREDGSRHEDRLNENAKDFRRAVQDLKRSFGDGRDLNRSANEAQRVFEAARRVQSTTSHHFYEGRLASDWAQIRQELRVIGDAYGNRGGDYGNDDYRRGNDSGRRNWPWSRN